MENDIKILLKKYFAGETSIAEEKALSEYFSSGAAVGEDMLYAASMFGHFAAARREIYPPLKATPLKRRTALRQTFYRSVAAAAVMAGAAILIFRGDGAPNKVYCYVNGMPITDPAVAMQHTEPVLEMISQALNTPADCLAPVIEQLQQTEAIIGEILNIK